MKLGTCLALLALGLNLAFSFGHHHVDDAGSGVHGHRAALAEGTAEAGHTGGEERGHDPCLTCIVVADAPVAAGPPALPLPGSAAIDVVATFACLEPRDSERPAFEARAPPCS